MPRKLIVFFLFSFSLCCVSFQAKAEEVTLIYFEGNVKVVSGEGDAEVSASSGAVITSGQKILTGETGYAEISFDPENNNTVKIKKNTEVVITGDQEERLELLDGELLSVLKNLKKGKEFRIRTPAAVCGARGTAWRTFSDGSMTDISVVEGKVFARGINPDGSLMKKTYWIKKGYERKIKKFDKPGKELRVKENRLSRIEKEIAVPLKCTVPEKYVKKEPGLRTDARKIAPDKEGLSNKVERTSDLRENIVKRAENKERMIKRMEKRDRIERVIERSDIIERRIKRNDNVEEKQREEIIDRRDLEYFKTKDTTINR